MLFLRAEAEKSKENKKTQRYFCFWKDQKLKRAKKEAGKAEKINVVLVEEKVVTKLVTKLVTKVVTKVK